jgi:hypothetical protein
MSFCQRLARKTVNQQQAYDMETQQMLQPWVTGIKEKFIQECEAAADRRLFSCGMALPRNPELFIRIGQDLLQQQLQGMLTELGFKDATANVFHDYSVRIGAEWTADDAASGSPERSLQAASGTCVTCPICHEHGPAVALVPCGHVVCRDCQRSKQLRQCPMCRKVITSATEGLFMD